MPVADDVKIGRGTKIWHPETSNIYGCEIGEDCNIGTLVEIRKEVIIGNRCKIQAFVFIPEGVTIGDDVFIGPHVCFTNDKYPSARTYGKFMETIVEDDVNIGANVTILCGVRIGEGATIGAGAVVTKDVNSWSTVVGNPARELKNG
jgi:acetyltransferase-like isoleucine patch superfamily enzyme